MEGTKLGCMTLFTVVTLFAGCAYEGSYTCVRFASETDGPCGDGLGCAEGNNCVDGTCELARQHGESCDESMLRFCAPPYLCEAGQCVGLRAAEGERCDWDEPSIDACAPGLHCFRGDTSCRAMAGVGERCFVDEQCPEATVCTREGVCGEGPGLMEPCTSTGGCAEGLACASAPDGWSCWPTPASEGDYCLEGTCPDGLTCLENPEGGRHCMVDLSEGMACEPYRLHENASCQNGLYCDTQAGVCARRRRRRDLFQREQRRRLRGRRPLLPARRHRRAALPRRGARGRLVSQRRSLRREYGV